MFGPRVDYFYWVLLVNKLVEAGRVNNDQFYDITFKSISYVEKTATTPLGSPVHDLWVVCMQSAVQLSSTSLSSQYPDQFVPVLSQSHVGIAQAADLLAGMHHRRVILAAESFTDFGQAMFGQFLRQRHRNLPRARQGSNPAL